MKVENAEKLRGLLGNRGITDSLKKAKSEEEVQGIFRDNGLNVKISEIEELKKIGEKSEKIGKAIGYTLLPTGLPQVIGFVLLGAIAVASKFQKK